MGDLEGVVEQTYQVAEEELKTLEVVVVVKLVVHSDQKVAEEELRRCHWNSHSRVRPWRQSEL